MGRKKSIYKRVKLNVRVDERLYKEIVEFCRNNDLTVTRFVEFSLYDKLFGKGEK